MYLRRGERINRAQLMHSTIHKQTTRRKSENSRATNMRSTVRSTLLCVLLGVILLHASAVAAAAAVKEAPVSAATLRPTSRVTNVRIIRKNGRIVQFQYTTADGVRRAFNPGRRMGAREWELVRDDIVRCGSGGFKQVCAILEAIREQIRRSNDPVEKFFLQGDLEHWRAIKLQYQQDMRYMEQVAKSAQQTAVAGGLYGGAAAKAVVLNRAILVPGFVARNRLDGCKPYARECARDVIFRGRGRAHRGTRCVRARSQCLKRARRSGAPIGISGAAVYLSMAFAISADSLLRY